MIDFVVAGGSLDRDEECGIGRQADAVIVALDLSVALAVRETLDAENIRQQPAAGIAGLHVGVHVFDEVILVALSVVDPRLGIAAPHARHVLAVLALGFATHRVSHAGGGQEIADIGGIDEHAAAISFSAERGDRSDALARHLHALPGGAIELLIEHDGHAGVGDHLPEDAQAHVGLEAADVLFAVGGGDGVIELRGDATEGVSLPEEVARAQPAGTHPAGEAGGVDPDHRASVAFGGDGGGRGPG